MSADTVDRHRDSGDRRPADASLRTAPYRHAVPFYLKITGIVVRTLFLVILICATALISLPLNVSASSLARFSSADFVRVGLGLMVCVCVAVQVFKRPQDDNGYRVWAWMGLAAVALLALVIAFKNAFPG